MKRERWDAYVFDGQVFVSEAGRASWMFVMMLIMNAYNRKNTQLYRTKYDEEVVPAVISDVENQVAKRYFVVESDDRFTRSFKKSKKTLLKTLLALEADMQQTHQDAITYLASDVTVMSNESLKECFLYFVEMAERFLTFPYVLRKFDRGIRGVFDEFYRWDPNVDQYLSVLAVSQQLSFLMQEERDILYLAQKQKQGEKVSDDEIQALYEKYYFGICGYYNETQRSIGYYEDKIATYAMQNPQDLLISLMDGHAYHLQERDKVVFSLPEEMLIYALAAGTVPYLKDLFKYNMNHILQTWEPILAEISKRFSIDLSVLKNALPDEIVWVFVGTHLDEAYIAQRAARCVVLSGYNDTQFIVGDEEVDAFRKKRLAADRNQGKWAATYKWRIACKGSATGTARVILWPQDFHKFKKWDILVAMNTSPDFVAIMSMASAIVAEEWGITAHVSVVSRELGIPCVVGISHITSSVKDGDLLEVDANTGIVTKK